MKRFFVCLIFLFVLTNILWAQPKFKGVRENLGKEINDDFDQVRPVFSTDGSVLYFSQGSGKNLQFEIWRTITDSVGRITGKELVKPLNPNTDGPKYVLQAQSSHQFLVNAAYRVEGSRLQYSRGVSSVDLAKGDNQFHPDLFERQNNRILDSIFKRKSILPVYHPLTNTWYWSDDNEGQQDIYFLPAELQVGVSLVKLPATINTKFDEITPWLDEEGHYLYFASNRPGGLGEMDIWVSERLDGSFSNWSKPVNLGPFVNTNKSETHFIIDPLNVYAYLASDKTGFGRNDLYRIALQPEDSAAGISPVLLSKDKPDTALLFQPQVHTTSNIVFLLDISHSMAQSRKIVMLKKAMYRLAQQLRPTDRISIVTFGSGVELLLSPQWTKSKVDIFDAIRILSANGGATNISAALQRAYEQCDAMYVAGGNNQLMLVTDGVFDLKPADEQRILQHSNVLLTAVVVGNDADVNRLLAPVVAKAKGQMLNMDNEAASLNMLLQNVRNNARIKK